MINRALRQRYSRQTIFPGIGEEGQAKLLESRVVVIGCGALGTNIAMHLARAGIGDIKIVDRDFVEIHNLQRQVIFTESDVKNQIPKAIAAERYLKKVNSTIKIKGIVADVNSGNIENLCRGADVIMDGLDNFETRFLINDAALKLKIPWVYGGAIASNGMTMTIIPGVTPCFRCLYPATSPPESVPNCETAGVVGTVPAIIGSIQATEAIKIITGSATKGGQALLIDVWDGSYLPFKVQKRKGCPACGGRYELLDKGFDVRIGSFCWQSRSFQVIDSTIKKANLKKIEAGLKDANDIVRKRYMLSFGVDDCRIFIFPDGRAIIKNTLDEPQARELYKKYVTELV